jgi:hypothetical protein
MDAMKGDGFSHFGWSAGRKSLFIFFSLFLFLGISQSAYACTCIGKDYQAIIKDIYVSGTFECVSDTTQGFPNNWDCWTNDHSKIVIKFPAVPETIHGKIAFYGLFDGPSQENEDLRVIVNGVTSEWYDPNTAEWTGWKWFTMPGEFTFNPGDNLIEMKHPLFDQEMSDGKDGQYPGYSIHYGYIKIFECYTQCNATTEICDGRDNDCDGQVDENLTLVCGSGSCGGVRTCTNGTWGSCSTSGNDCGTCCRCDINGTAKYDGTQNGDCSPTNCPADGCGVGTCGVHIFGDYPSSVQNICSSIYTCTSRNCNDYLTCGPDADSDGYSPQCGDCNDSNSGVHPGATEVCDGRDNDCDGTIDEGCQCTPGATQSCGSNGCAGTRTCSQAGTWGQCSSSGTDCGVCCRCDGNGNKSYDGTQNSDCAATICPGGCSIDSNPFTYDFSQGVPNYCIGLNLCSNNACNYTHDCRDGNATDGKGPEVCGSECDQNSDCINKCIGSTRYYSGYCNSTFCSCSYQTEDCNKYDNASAGYHCYPASGDLYYYYQDWTCSAGSCVYSGNNFRGGMRSDCRQACSDTDSGKDYFTAGTATAESLCTSENQTYCPVEERTDICSGPILTEYYCMNNQKYSVPKNCSEFDCTTPSKFTCTGAGTSTIREIGDMYGCSSGACGLTGNTTCRGPWVCNQQYMCQRMACGSSSYTCYLSNGMGWLWGTPEVVESNCGDWYDNDCDGKTDCADPDCTGKSGPDGTLCCATNSDCDIKDLPSIATCDYNPDGYHPTWDTHVKVESVCSSYICTQPQYGNITHMCNDNNLTDGVSGGACSALCDQNSDCPQTTSFCNYLERRRCTRDGFGTCNSYFCACISDDWSCGAQDDGNYCSGCTHCGDGQKNCGEQCESGSDCQSYCSGKIRYYSGVCKMGCECSFVQENCSKSDGWYDSGQWTNQDCKRCKPQEYRTYGCSPGSCNYTVTNTRQYCEPLNEGNVCDESGFECSNSCTAGKEEYICKAGECVFHRWKDQVSCSPSSCIDGSCNGCSLACGAECDDNGDCGPTECDQLDGCYSGTYRNYTDMQNTCSSCYCTDNTCTAYTTKTTDADGDGYDIECDSDCNDTNPNIHPGAPELCNGLDDNCNGIVDEGCQCTPGATHACGFGGCTGLQTCNSSGMWSGACSSIGRDCGVCCSCDVNGIALYNDTQDYDCGPTGCPADRCGADGCGVHIFGDYPASVQNVCLGLLVCTYNDCDNYVTCSGDADGDGYSLGCGDCNDSDPSIHEAAEEICDGKDNDCDGQIDEGCECTPGATQPCGGGACAGTKTCSQAGGWSSCSTGGSDCGTCCLCSPEGSALYDETQDLDCSDTSCPSGCGIDANPYTWDFSVNVHNYCSGLNVCTNNQCSYQHECRDNDHADGVDGNACGAACDQNSDCTDKCDWHIRYYAGRCDLNFSCQCAYESEDCNNYDCSAPNPFICDGVGTDTIKETGNDYNCGQGNCIVAGPKTCNGPWTCSGQAECKKQECGPGNQTCYFSNGFLWGTPSVTETNCSDGHDNDCDGKIDCADPDCLGQQGSGGAVCCQTGSNCADGNPCTTDACIGNQCSNAVNDTNTCSDGLYCTISDHCSDGSCVGSQKDCDDQSECTTDSCSEAQLGQCVNTNLPDQTPCGEARNCDDDQCILLNWTIYPDDGHDYCLSGVCNMYSCSPLSSDYDQRCEPPCYTWTVFTNGNDTNYILFPAGGGSDSTGKVSMPTNILITDARVDLSGFPVSYISDKKIDITVITDVSGSMDDDCGPDGRAQPGETPCKINDAKTADKELINIALNYSSNNVGLVSYSTTLINFTELTKNKTVLFDQIDTYSSLATTCISCGIEKATEIISQGTNPTKVILLMTDGKANRCIAGECTDLVARTEAIDKARHAWEQHGIIVHAVAFGADADQATMQEIANVGHGEYYYAASNDIIEFYKSLMTKLVETYPTNPQLDVGSNGASEWSFTGEFTGTETAHFVEELNKLTHKCQATPCPGCQYNISSGNCTVDMEAISDTTGILEMYNLYIYGCECMGGTCPPDDPPLGITTPPSGGGAATLLAKTGGSGGGFAGVAPLSVAPQVESAPPAQETTIDGPYYSDNVLTLKGCLKDSGSGTITLYVGKDLVQEAQLDENGCFEIQYSSELPKGMNKITLWNEDAKILETYVPSYSTGLKDNTRRGSSTAEEIKKTEGTGATGLISWASSSPLVIAAAILLTALSVVALPRILSARKGSAKKGEA